MKTYVLGIVLEPDEDFDGHVAGWHVYVPAPAAQGASTWGETQADALHNLREVLEMTVESMTEHSEPLPVDPEGDVQVFKGARMTVTV